MAVIQKQKKRSPLRQKPLHNPGESLEGEIQRLLEDRLLPPFVVAVVAIVLAVYEWWRWEAAQPPQPVVMAAVATVAVAWVAYVVAGLKKRMRSLRLGLDGEKTVGQFLEANRKEGWYVLHDIPAVGFNVDHVLIAPQGVFVIETKTYSKPVRGDATAQFDGKRLLVNGFEPERNPITQARAIRDWVANLLQETTAKRYPVKGVVVLPGWYVSGRQDRGDIWVLNNKALLQFIERERCVVKDEDVALAYSRLSNYVVR